jgi:hypothetical protein
MFCAFTTRKKRSTKSRYVLKLRSFQQYHFVLRFIEIYVITKFNSQMGAYDIEDALAWKKKIEQIIDQVQ